MSAIKIVNLGKRYESANAVRCVSLSVAEGELFGLIGPDGAGKTTLMRAVCTLIVPDEGTIQIQGMDVRQDIMSVRKRLGYMPQRFSLYQDLSVEQNLRFFADLFQVPEEEQKRRLEQLYRFSRLEPFKQRKAGALSGGMKQKLALSCALIHTPDVLVLDEPTYGVDPVSRQEFWDILRSIQEQGTTILVSTVYMDEADQCDRVALMDRGAFIFVGTPDEIKAGFPYLLYRVKGGDAQTLRIFFDHLQEVSTTQLFGDAVHVGFKREPKPSDWKGWKKETGFTHWEPKLPSVEDCFMELTEKKG
ncbi:MAG: ABC transporter ATP-binding protein [bacterium]